METQTRAVNVQMRLPAKEHETLKAEAIRAGMTFSAYMRSILIGERKWPIAKDTAA